MANKNGKKGFFGEFKDFITRGNVLDMAVGVIVATAFGKITTSLVNAVIMPVAQILSLPITVLTLGIFYLVVNAFMLQLASGLSVAAVGSGIEIDSFGSAFVGSIIISIASMVIHGVLAG